MWNSSEVEMLESHSYKVLGRCSRAWNRGHVPLVLISGKLQQSWNPAPCLTAAILSSSSPLYTCMNLLGSLYRHLVIFSRVCGTLLFCDWERGNKIFFHPIDLVTKSSSGVKSFFLRGPTPTRLPIIESSWRPNPGQYQALPILFYRVERTKTSFSPSWSTLFPVHMWLCSFGLGTVIRGKVVLHPLQQS